MDASVPSAVGDAPMRSKRVANDSTFRGALLHGASYQTRTTAEGDAATTGVTESTPHKEASTNFLLIWLSCFARSSLNGWMKTSAVTNRSRAVQILLSLLCAGFLGLSLGGCAGTYYAEASATPESRYNTYYGPYYYPYYPWYAYYGGAYNYGVIR